MSKLPGFRRLNTQDFEEDQKEFVEQIAASLNYGIEVLYDTLNKRVTLADNIACSLRDVTVSVDATGKPKQAASCTLDSQNIVIGTQVIFAQAVSGSATVTSTPFITFTQNGTTLQIQRVTGIPANIPFVIRLIAYT